MRRANAAGCASAGEALEEPGVLAVDGHDRGARDARAAVDAARRRGRGSPCWRARSCARASTAAERGRRARPRRRRRSPRRRRGAPRPRPGSGATDRMAARGRSVEREPARRARVRGARPTCAGAELRHLRRRARARACPRPACRRRSARRAGAATASAFVPIEPVEPSTDTRRGHAAGTDRARGRARARRATSGSMRKRRDGLSRHGRRPSSGNSRRAAP